MTRDKRIMLLMQLIQFFSQECSGRFRFWHGIYGNGIVLDYLEKELERELRR
jgi:hypothetical protein